MEIHKPPISLYAPIVVLSIVIGILVAVLLMKKAGAKKETLGLTAFFTFVSIIICSFMMSISLAGGDIRKIGFVGAGGALGLLVGATVSVLIHRDHVKECFASWIIVLPLMYGLSKIACHVTGCCHGIEYRGFGYVIYPDADNIPYFPVQLTEVIAFILIFGIGIVILNLKSYMAAAETVLGLSAAAKIGLEFLRMSHVGKTLTGYQLLIAGITALAYIVIAIIKRKNSSEKEIKSNGQ